MKPSALIFAIWLVASCPSWAGDQDGRLVEFSGPSGNTVTFDLSTVQMIQPGPQLLADFFTVEKLAKKMLAELREAAPNWEEK